MEINTLPVEILERVFFFVDGSSLVRALFVCKLWREIIEAMKRRYELWRICCFRDMSVDMALELRMSAFQEFENKTKVTGNTLKEDHLRNNNTWLNVHCQWSRQKLTISRTNLVLKKTLAKNFSSNIHVNGGHNDIVTALKVHGNRIISGHQNGGVYIWDNDGILPMKCVGRHYKTVSDLITIPREFTMKKSNQKNSDDSHVLIISVSRDRIINMFLVHWCKMEILAREMIHYHPKPINCISIWLNTFVVGDDNGYVSIWSVHCNDVIPHSTMKKYIWVHAKAVIKVHVWRNQIFCISQKGELKILDLNSGSCLQDLQLDGDITPFFNVCFFRGNLALNVSGKPDHFTQTCLLPPLCQSSIHFIYGAITAITMWGHLLAIGTAQGLIVFYVNSKEDLDTLNIEKPTVVLKMTTTPNHIDISDDGNGPIIVAASNTELNVYRWMSSSIKQCNLGISQLMLDL